MNSKFNLVHIVTNDFKNDNRVKRAALIGCELFLNVAVLCLHRRSDSLLDYEDNKCYTVYRSRLKTLKWPKILPFQFIKYVEAIFRMVIIIKTLRPKVIHCHDLSGLIIGSVSSLFVNTKIVYDSHEYLVQSTGFIKYPFIIKILLAWIEKKLASKCHAIITVSESIASKLSSKFGIDNIIVIRNIPLKMSLNSGHGSRDNLLREKYNISVSVPLIVYSGGIGKWRGLELLISAFSLIQDQSSKLIFMGNGALEEELKALAIKLGVADRVIFNGAVPPDEVTSWLRGATVGVHPMEGVNLNHQYALPNKFFEYLHACVPVLTSDMLEMKKIIDKYNIGLTFKDKDIDSFVSSLNVIIKSDINSNKRQSIKYFLNDFSWENERDKLYFLYQSLL